MRFSPTLLTVALGAAATLPLAAQTTAPAAPAAASTTTATTAVEPFEGVITMTVGRRAQPVTYSVRQGRIRVDATGRGGRGTTVVVNTPQRVVDVLAPGQRVYYEQALVADSIPTLAALGIKVTHTGRTSQVAGRSCEHWTIVDDRGQTIDACMASGLGALAGIERVGNLPLLSDLGTGGFFPMQATLASTGETLLRVTAVQPRRLDAGVFAMPAGYEKVTVAAGTGLGR